MSTDREPQAGQIYKHFKNKLYQVLAVATHFETGEKMVVYQRLYDDFSVYVRPYSMFTSEVDHVKYPKVKQKYRFELWNPQSQREELQQEEIKILQKEEVRENTKNPVQKVEAEMPEECNPDLMRFLEADTYEEKRNILISIRKRVDDRLINDIAASLDVTVDDGDIDTRFRSLLSCLDMMKRFECNNRLR